MTTGTGPIQGRDESDEDYARRRAEWEREQALAELFPGATTAEERDRSEGGRDIDLDGDGNISEEEWAAYEASDPSAYTASRENAAAARSYRRARRQAEWDAMSYEERQAARARGERPPSEETPEDTNTWNDWSRGTPFEGWSGESYDQETARAAAEAARRAGIIGDLAGSMPTEDELSVEYGGEDMIGPGEDSLLARDALREWAEGGFTDADRAMMEEARRREGMAARADREANMSALEARGMGGSGATLASMLSAGEGAAMRGAATDASMMGAAQQRQYDATGALGAFGAREDEYARGREGRNTDRENRTRESAAEAAQRAYENRENITSYQLGGDPNSATNAAADRRDEEEDELFGAVGGTLESLFS